MRSGGVYLPVLVMVGIAVLMVPLSRYLAGEKMALPGVFKVSTGEVSRNVHGGSGSQSGEGSGHNEGEDRGEDKENDKEKDEGEKSCGDKYNNSVSAGSVAIGPGVDGHYSAYECDGGTGRWERCVDCDVDYGPKFMQEAYQEYIEEERAKGKLDGKDEDESENEGEESVGVESEGKSKPCVDSSSMKYQGIELVCAGGKWWPPRQAELVLSNGGLSDSDYYAALAEKGLSIVKDLEVGFWNQYNRHPDYSFDESYYESNPVPEEETGVVAFYCTSLVSEVYKDTPYEFNYEDEDSNLSPHTILSSTTMYEYFEENDSYLPNGPGVIDQIKPGYTIFFKAPDKKIEEAGGGTGIFHVGIVYDIDEEGDQITIVEANAAGRVVDEWLVSLSGEIASMPGYAGVHGFGVPFEALEATEVTNEGAAGGGL